MDNIHYGFTLFSLAGPGTWTFFTNVLNEVMGLFPGKYIHCGGDEEAAGGRGVPGEDGAPGYAAGVSTGLFPVRPKLRASFVPLRGGQNGRLLPQTIPHPVAR